MLTIDINPIVLQTLKEAFPKANSAEKSLDKYIKLLTAQLTKSVLHGRSAWMESQGLFSISIYRQRNRGSQIGPSKIRLQNWLEDHNLELFKVSQLGSNLSKRLSVVRLTELVTLHYSTESTKTSKDLDINNILETKNNLKRSGKDFFENIYPDLESMTEDEIHHSFDIVQIDINSLKNYMHWLSHDTKYLSNQKQLQYRIQAETILRIAEFTDGFYFQRKKSSSFGRNYYSGISVQNVNKELRRAMLGHCWEYDIRSSVFSWKMGFAQECYESLDVTEPFDKTFSMTLNYLNDKNDFMMTVRHYTFNEYSELSKDLKDKLIKRAVTAISFGARRGTTGWIKNGSDWKNPALVDIFQNREERDRFLNCCVMKIFIQEQNLLDKYIFQTCKDENSSFLQKEEVRTDCGLLSKAKVIAYLYQHFETEVMDVAARAIESVGRKVLARIHDAIIIDKRLGVDNKQYVEHTMQAATGNPYWHLVAKELLPFERPFSLDRAEIDDHKQRIIEETRFAEGYEGKFSQTI